jgi:hypothetical protein
MALNPVNPAKRTTARSNKHHSQQPHKEPTHSNAITGVHHTTHGKINLHAVRSATNETLNFEQNPRKYLSNTPCEYAFLFSQAGLITPGKQQTPFFHSGTYFTL